MREILIPFSFSLLFSILITFIVRKLSFKFGLLDLPDGYLKPHSRAVPYTGGLSLIISLLITSLLFGVFDEGLFIPLVIFFLIGFVDDIRGLTPTIRFCVEIIASLIFVVMGYSLNVTGYSLLDSILTVFFVVSLINAVNLYDGMDGLVAGSSIPIAMSFLFLFYFLGMRDYGLLSLLILATVTALYIFNFPDARIFLGDQGSYSIGFILSFLSVVLERETGFEGLIFIFTIYLILIFDTGFAILRRLIGKRPISEGDRSHIYDKMERKSGKKRLVSVELVLLEFFLVLCGITVFLFDFPASWIFILLAIFSVSILTVKYRLWLT